MQRLPVMAGTLCQYHEQGDDVLRVHLEEVVHRNQWGLTLEVMATLGEATFVRHRASMWEVAWAPQ